MSADPRTSIRRALAWALVGALCVAALTAIGAILTGDFDETDGRVIGTSLGFAIFSATAASGASLRFRAAADLRTVGPAAGILAVSGATEGSGDPGNRAPEITRDCERTLARSHSR